MNRFFNNFSMMFITLTFSYIGPCHYTPTLIPNIEPTSLPSTSVWNQPPGFLPDLDYSDETNAFIDGTRPRSGREIHAGARGLQPTSAPPTCRCTSPSLGPYSAKTLYGITTSIEEATSQGNPESPWKTPSQGLFVASSFSELPSHLD